MAKRVLTVLGARPQFIKASVVSAAIKQNPSLSETVVHTGQHFDANMSDVFFQELGMDQPAHNLDIHGGHHGEMTGRMLAGLEAILLADKPDIVMVYGDTNSTLAGALAAVKLHIPVAHVEAGLRSFNMRMPEEVNRILTDRVSQWLFTPTAVASANLRAEGYAPERIIQTGDVMNDVAQFYGKRVSSQGGILQKLGLTAGRYVLATVHRAENTDDPLRLRTIAQALGTAARDRPVVWPMHPRTRALLTRMDLLDPLKQGVHVVDPVGYLDMLQLEKFAALVATDSGGVQKEAFFHRVPCVTLRDETEWTELVDAGWNRLAAPDSEETILQAIAAALSQTPREIQPYGDGHAAQAIATRLSA